MKMHLGVMAAVAIVWACTAQPEEEFFGIRLDHSAEGWNEAMPIGNGRLGAMVYGGADQEHIQLNECTLYSGEPSTAWKGTRIAPTYDQVVSLIKEGKNYEAGEIVRREWLGALHQNYQPMTDLYLDNTVGGEISGYKRELNMNDAVVTVNYAQNGVNYKREIVSSKPDDVIAIRMTADKKKSVSFKAHFGSLHPTAVQSAEDGTLIMKGQAPGYAERRSFEELERWGATYRHPYLYDENGNRKVDHTVLYGDECDGMGMYFDSRIMVDAKGGKVSADADGLTVEGADEVILILSGATSFNGWDKSPSREGVDASAKSEAIAAAACGKSWKELKTAAVADYKADFDECKLDIPHDKALAARNTDERIASFQEDEDPALVNLLFQYGRYLMIVGSRPGEQPLNLQGIWNPDIIPPWNGAYTINLNLQITYWPAEITGLGKYTEPLFRLIKEAAQSGTETARDMYGRPGWVIHHNVSIWRETYPNDNGVQASYWPMAGPWLCSHMWEHWLYTGDEKFLREEAYPLMKSSAEFYKTWLVEDDNGYLVTPVATSPENVFKDEKGRRCAVDRGTTMDMSLLRELFSRIYEATRILGVDKDFGDELKALAGRLRPFQIGSQGQIMEWSKDYETFKTSCFHQLYSFCPGDQITWADTPGLIPAVMKSMEISGDATEYWEAAWKDCVWARLFDGDRAYRQIKGGFSNNMSETLVQKDNHQTEVRFGTTAGIVEMLLQGHEGFVHLLPALPSAWPEGSVSGLRARGGFVCDMQWAGGKLSGATVKSLLGQTCVLVASVPFRVAGVTAEPYELGGKTWYKATFDTEKDKTYKLSI